MSFRARLAWSWGAALLLPFILMFLVQIPLCVITPLSQYVEKLNPYKVIVPITLICLLPGYIPFIVWLKTQRALWINLALATLILVPLMIPVWISGLVTSRLLFDRCTSDQSKH